MTEKNMRISFRVFVCNVFCVCFGKDREIERKRGTEREKERQTDKQTEMGERKKERDRMKERQREMGERASDTFPIILQRVRDAFPIKMNQYSQRI